MFTVTIGPSRPRYGGIAGGRYRSADAISSLARICARHAPTTVIDGHGGAMVLGAAAAGDVDLW